MFVHSPWGLSFATGSTTKGKLKCTVSLKQHSDGKKVKVKSLSRIWLFVTPWTVAYRFLCLLDFPGKNTGVGCHCLLQAFPNTCLFFLFLKFIFNLRKIALQCCVAFCQTTTQLRHTYVCVCVCVYLPSLPLESPSPPPSHPSRSSQSTRLDSLCYIAASHCLSILHMITDLFFEKIYIRWKLPIHEQTSINCALATIFTEISKAAYSSNLRSWSEPSS